MLFVNSTSGESSCFVAAFLLGKEYHNIIYY